MSRHREYISLGLFTAPDAAELQPGQLSDIRNAVYFPGSQALTRATGRTAFGTVSASAIDVNGLRDIEFDNGLQVLVAMSTIGASSTYSTAVVGDTGTFGVLASGLPSGSQLEAAHFRNRFYLWNGAAVDASASPSNRVIYLSATGSVVPIVRNHGMLAVLDSPTVTTAAGTFSQTVTGYYEYWTTEVAKLSADGAEFTMESTFAGTPTTVLITATGQVPTIEQPTIRNTLATHWRVYRSPKKDTATDKKFPTGFSIGEVGTATTGLADTATTTTSSFFFPGSFNTAGAATQGDFTNASAMGADDGNVATVALPSGFNLGRKQGVYNFPFTGIVGVIRGIEVVLEGFSTVQPQSVSVTIGANRDPGTQRYAGQNGAYSQQFHGFVYAGGYTASKSATITSTSAPGTTLTFGGPTDRWFPTNEIGMSDVDFNATFMVVVTVNGSLRTVSFDYVKIRVYYGGSVDSTVVFPTVVYTFGDIVAQVGKNGPPPSSSTGDIYEDSLVVNDVSNPSLLRYSYPGDPEAFPATYFIDFETRENDRVRLIRVVNNRLIVGLDASLWRVNYLPSERDASFDRGKAIEAISRSYGIVNPMCACTFSMGGGAEILAGVSHQGIFGTDGYSFDFYTDGLDWRQVIGLTGSNPIALVNDPENAELLFYYQNDAGPGVFGASNETFLCLHLAYGEEHLVNGKPKVSGPVNMRNFISAQRGDLKSAWVAPRSSGGRSVYLGYGLATAAGAGTVYRENGTTIPAEDPRMKYTTRRMYLNDFGGEWRLNEVYGYVGDYTASATANYTVLNCKTDDTGEATLSSKSKVLLGQKLHKVLFNQGVEGARISFVATASAYAQEFLVLDGQGFGLEDSGRG